MIELFFSQYKEYSTLDISLEIIGVLFGLASVLYAKKDNILVFPTGIISTIIFIYLLWKWELLGDMLINFYYTIMSIYGWYHWTRKKNGQTEFPISWMNSLEKKWAIFLFILTVIFIIHNLHLLTICILLSLCD
jgi:nicotinamide mononucleotide transporter